MPFVRRRINAIPMEMDRRPPIHSMERTADVSMFEKVRAGLAESNTVGWDNAHLSIELAIRMYRSPPSKRFLNDLLQQITGIMLDQVSIEDG